MFTRVNSILSGVLLLFGVITSGADLVRDGHATAEIIIKKGAAAPTVHAAEELSFWLKKITGASLPILSKASQKANTKIYVGSSLAENYSKDLIALKGSDGFAVRSKEKNIYIFAAAPRGTLNGVYAFLEHNTDIIWLRPDPDLGTVFTKKPNLAIKWADGIDRPLSRLRGWGFTMSRSPYAKSWASRNRCNYLGYTRDQTVAMGADFVPTGGGHGLKIMVSAKDYFRSNPEFFTLRDGKRKPDGQLCFTSKSLIPIYIANVKKKLDAAPKFSNGLNISSTDGWKLCDCPNCLKDIQLPDGKRITSRNPAFRSTQFFIFLNKIAKAIAKSHPGVDILTYAYTFTIDVPKVQVEPNIRVMYCTFVKNDKFNIFDPKENRMWIERTVGWGKMSPKTMLREYYGCGSQFPRPLEDMVAKDLQFCLKNKIFDFNSELPVDITRHKSNHCWDASSMTMWIITRLWWNPNQDVNALRKYYLERTFRESAPMMAKYFQIIRDSWYNDRYPSLYSDEQYAVAKHYIIEKGLENDCREILAKAEKNAKHPISLKLVKRHRQRFEEWMEVSKKNKNPTLNIPVMPDGGIAGQNFDSKFWEKAALISDFVIAKKADQKPSLQSQARIFHDRKNLYIMITAIAPKAQVLIASKMNKGGGETFPDKGDHYEIFLANPQTGTYYQFAADIGAKVLYDAKGYEAKWQSHWKVITRRNSDNWQMIATIPLDDIGCNVTVNNKLKLLILRSKNIYTGKINPKTKCEIVKREMSSWGGGWVHQVSGFGKITLQQ